MKGSPPGTQIPVWTQVCTQTHRNSLRPADTGAGSSAFRSAASKSRVLSSWRLTGFSGWICLRRKRPRAFAEPLRIRGEIQAAVDAFALTPLRSATVFNLVFAAFSSLRLVVRKRTISSWPSSSAHAISVP